MRLPTNPGDILDDSVSTPRGLALKIMGVGSPRLQASEGETTQDFVMINAPMFTAATPKAFLGSLKLLARATGRAPRGKKAFCASANWRAHAGAEACL